MTVGSHPQSRVRHGSTSVGKHYNEGYLAAIACGSFLQNRIVRRAPSCPYAGDTELRRSWFAGLMDSARDREIVPA